MRKTPIGSQGLRASGITPNVIIFKTQKAALAPRMKGRLAGDVVDNHINYECPIQNFNSCILAGIHGIDAWRVRSDSVWEKIGDCTSWREISIISLWDNSCAKGKELRSQLGQFVELDVHIEQVSTPRNGNVYLNIGGSFPNAILTLIIFKNNLSAFGDVDIKPGHNLRVKGRLTEYKGSLQIILQNRQQVVSYDK